MHISNFDDLLQAARYQPLPQRLLFVFTAVELPSDCSAQQAADFASGQGGELAPIMCVDKSPQELDSFAALCGEAKQFNKPWGLVFAAALSGTPGQQPSGPDVDSALQRMVEDLKQGRMAAYLPFDTNGQPVQLA